MGAAVPFNSFSLSQNGQLAMLGLETSTTTAMQIQGTSNTAQSHKSSLSKTVKSPALSSGTGNKRTVNGLFIGFGIIFILTFLHLTTLSTPKTHHLG